MGRARWSSRTIFLFAAIGSAVGLGNVWRFPYLAYEYGGGAFLIPYLIALFVIGIPLLMLEFALGQKIQQGAVGAFKAIHRRLRGIGIGGLAGGFIVSTYYAVVMAWALLFFINSFRARLPWAEDAKGFFFNAVLQISDGAGAIGGINWYLFFSLLVVWVMIYFCIWKGVKSVGKVVAVTMPLPVILLIVLFFRGITLDGAGAGIGYYLRPDFTVLLNTEVWLAAASQIFFTLSLAFGIMIAYASYNRKEQNVAGDAFITAITNSSISIFAGFVVFSVLGYMAMAGGVGVGDVAASGPGLAFVVFPQALALLPWGAWFFAALFFLTLLSLGIDSAFSLVEAVNTAIKDRWKKASTAKIAALVCGAMFLLGIIYTTRGGLYYLDIVDHFVVNYLLVLVGFFEAVAVGWLYGPEKLRKFINSVSSWKVGRWWNYTIKYVIPLVLAVLLVVQFVREIRAPYEGYPAWALSIGWAVVIVPLIIALALVFKKK